MNHIPRTENNETFKLNNIKKQRRLYLLISLLPSSLEKTGKVDFCLRSLNFTIGKSNKGSD